ncbi:putative diguanylate cyclase YdaM [compost metagenome]
MLLPGANLEVAAAVAERLRVAVQDTSVEPVGAVTVSLGVAHWPGTAGSGPGDTLSKADRALYSAKQSGRNRVCIEPA